ncbi:MAG: dephospho-CoA kinase [Bacteroidetes bacterium]|nr:dephospho-CoA kinase [Bacteroidota bacterium]
MLIVGLTGGIGSGKSTIAGVFQVLGATIYSSDERAKQLYFVPKIKQQVETIFGKEAYLDNEVLNKKYIAEKIFSNARLLNQINELIHAEVKKDFEIFIKQHAKAKYIIKESALLIEANILPSLHKLVVVTAPIALRKGRTMKRDNLSEQEFEKRISQQLPDEEKIKKADWVLHNSEEDLLIPQIIKIHQALMR